MSERPPQIIPASPGWRLVHIQFPSGWNEDMSRPELEELLDAAALEDMVLVYDIAAFEVHTTYMGSDDWSVEYRCVIADDWPPVLFGQLGGLHEVGVLQPSEELDDQWRKAAVDALLKWHTSR